MQKGFSIIEVIIACALLSLIVSIFLDVYAESRHALHAKANALQASVLASNAHNLVSTEHDETLKKTWVKEVSNTLPGGQGHIRCVAKTCFIDIHWQTPPFDIKLRVQR